MFVRTPTYFAPDDESGAAPVGEAPDPVVEAAPPTGEIEPTTETPPPAEEPVVVDWGSRVTEWGGEQTIAEALELQKALSTREGVNSLFREAGRALGLGDAAIDALFNGGTPAVEESNEPSIEDLLGDPDRILTAGEVQRILQHQAQQQQAQTQQQREVQQVLSSIESAFTDLKVEDEGDRMSILALADTLVPAGQTNDPVVVDRAIRTAHERFQAKVQAAAEAIVKNRHEAHEQLPTPLPTGGGSGGGAVEEEPLTLAEAKERARKQLGIS